MARRPHWQFLLACLAAGWAVACALNPQPDLPGASQDGGVAAGPGSPTGGNAAGAPLLPGQPDPNAAGGASATGGAAASPPPSESAGAGGLGGASGAGATELAGAAGKAGAAGGT